MVMPVFFKSKFNDFFKLNCKKNFFSCVSMKARPAAKMSWAYLFCKNEYNTIGFLYTIKYTKKQNFNKLKSINVFVF